MRTPRFRNTMTVTVRTHTPDGYDGGGRQKFTDSEAPSAGWVMWPGSTRENDDVVEDIVTDRVDVLAPPGVDVTYLQQVKLPGSDSWYEVNGRPWPWESPLTGTVLGTQIVLKAVN